MNYQERYDLWLNRAKDENILNELKNMSEEDKNLAFFKDIEFGTAGMRGTIGAGSNCMNIYNVAKVTKALCDYLNENNKKSVAVSYDSRNMSYEFAKVVANICVNNNIKVYFADKMMPTPFLSYMVRFYGCGAGVMITASHNPKEYNGYKVYGEDGCQMLEEPSIKIMHYADDVDPFSIDISYSDEILLNEMVCLTDNKILSSYFEDVKKQAYKKVNNLKIVYTALNGTGINTIPDVLESQGTEIIFNEVQCKADKNFTTCEYPNPEKDEVFDTSIKLAKDNDCDLILASDPDADRVGIKILHKGEYIKLTGNQVGVLLTDYLFSKKKRGYLVKSIVTTSLAEKVAQKYGGKTYNVLTGFKYIGEFITNLEKENRQEEYVLGFEESYGYLVGTHVRDKDATVASMLICEMASELKSKGITLMDRLNEIYDEFGLYENKVLSFKFAGAAGNEKMKKLLLDLRVNPPKNFGELKVLNIIDYKDGYNGLPKANVISYDLENNIQLLIRPSGTEPLIKVYITLTQTKELNKENLDKLTETLKDMFA